MIANVHEARTRLRARYSDLGDSRMYELPCLCGEDVRRERGALVAEIVDGTLVDGRTGEALHVGHATYDLCGWGDLDGKAVLVGPADGTWRVSVPVSVVDHLRRMHGLEAARTC